MTTQGFVASHAKDARFERGLRSFFEYRDRGIKGATEGRVDAHVIRAAAGKEFSSQPHLHKTTFQIDSIKKIKLRVIDMSVSAALVAIAVAVAVISSAHAAPAPDKAAVEAIQSATAGKIKAAKGRTYDKDCGQDIDYEAEAIDLNGDGQLEVMTQEFGSCFGRAGVQMNLYLKAKNGTWKPQFGFPGSPKVLKQMSNGFPDIEVLGPGTCFPVWRYDGRQYQVVKTCR